MSNILIDTYIFRNLEGKFRTLLLCISITGDTIILTRKIENGYRLPARSPSHLGYRAYRNSISSKCELRDIKSNRIEAKFNRYKRELEMPRNSRHHKWIRTAISEKAKYIISNNDDLFRPPFRTNSESCEVIYPINYIRENCPQYID